MAKILKNQTSPAVDIEVFETGVSIPASGQIEVDPINYLYWSIPEVIIELTPYINSGDIIVNDGLRDLTNTEALDYMRYPDTALSSRFLNDTYRSNGFSSDNVQDAIEEAKTTVSGKMQDFEFFTQGNTQNKWVNIGHPSDNSLDVPFIALWSGKVCGISYSNQNDDSSTDLEFYVNGTLVYTWQIRNKRLAYITNEAGLFNLAQSDRVSIFAKKIDGSGIINPSGLSGEVMSIISAVGTSSGGIQTGV